MKLSKKGFVASAVLYSLLLLFLALILGLLALLSNRKNILDKLKSDIKGNITKINVFDFYENGTTVYYNPVKGELCANYTEDNSKTGVTEGCLKWYTFNDNANNASVNMILDHNTSGNVAWSTDTNNPTVMKEVIKRLEEDTSTWKQTTRLITADEVAEITGANLDTTIKWNSSKTYGTGDTETYYSWFYLSGSGTTYSNTDGWQKQVSNATTKSKYAWLFDNTYNCIDYGCNVEDNNEYPYGTKDSTNTAVIEGYWTSTPINGFGLRSWCVGRIDDLSFHGSINTQYYFGVRPVITIKKSELKLKENTKFVYNYTGKEQNFITPVDGKYKIELWGAQGGTTIGVDSNYSGNEGGKGGYVSGSIFLKKYDKLYVYTGKQGGIPTKQNDEDSRGYNGGGIGGYDTTCSETYVGTCIKEAGSGGGSTDIRLVNGIWNGSESLNSRIMVAGGGGGVSNWKNVRTGGNAGGLIGFSGTEYNLGTNSYINATGGTQVIGGSGANGGDIYLGSSGMFGIGGNSYFSYGGGGGGGYYGGGGGSLNSNVVGSGAGGSSYISGFLGSVAITSATDTTPKSGCTDGTKDINCSYHYSGLVFTETNMIAGNESMPTHDGKSTMIGNSGNGYAKITYLGS